ncbi:MAG: PEP-CTERM sorting domain-containing protein, partial [Limisphaerales bacterium]
VVSEFTFGLSDTVNLYIDPTPGGSQPITPDATQTSSTSPATSANNVGFKAQSNTAQGDFIIDNVMIGTTWADVTPAPEPSTLVLAGLGLLGLVARVRRVRR